MKCGIIGLPNVGKSTLFKSLTAIPVPAENYPFCTIEANVGVVPVPDPRLEKLEKIFQPKKKTAPVMEFFDVAGLVKGAHKGEGLGAKFLSHIRQCEALIHVVRCFEGGGVSHVFSNIDPLRDIEIIESELILADLDIVAKRLQKIEKPSQADKKLRKEVEVLKNLSKFLDSGRRASHYPDLQKEGDFIFDLHLLTGKPSLYLCNGDDSKTSLDLVKKVREKAGEGSVMTLSGKLEADLAELPLEEQKDFLRDLNLKEPALHRLIRKSYKLLNLITFFTAGKEEVRGWTLKEGSLAPEAGARIHSDFKRGFIRAEVYSAADLFCLGSYMALKQKGLLREKGKDYIVKDGDVLFFKFNV